MKSVENSRWLNKPKTTPPHHIIILPELPNEIAENHKAEILEWCSNYIYAVLAAQDKKNEWLKIASEVDFKPVEAAWQPRDGASTA